MSDDELGLSRRKILGATAVVGTAGAGAGLGTSALFSDEESFENNSITAGELDLIVDYYTSTDQGSFGSTSQSGEVSGNGAAEYAYDVVDLKPGDSGTLAFCPKVVDNPGWLWVGSEDGVTDYENGQTEPEEDIDATGDGNLDNGTNDGAGAGELSDEIEVTVSYAESVSLDSATDEITCNNPRELNNPDDYTLADLAKDLESGFPLDGDQPDGDNSIDAYPSSSDGDDQQGPCLCIEWELPVEVGNEIQSDALELSFQFAAEQERNNSNPDNPFVDATVGPSGGSYDFNSIQDAIDDSETSEGDVISVASGSFSELVTVDTADLTIAGAGESETTIDASDRERGIAIEADGVTVCDLTVNNAGSGVSSGEVEGIFVGDANGFTDEDEIITIRDVTVSNVDAGDSTAEGIHVKSYDSGDPIDGVSIKNVTIDGVDTPGDVGGANGIKLQSDLNNVTIDETSIKNVTGSWSYGVTLTPASVESGLPTDVSINSSTIADVTAINFDGVGIGIDSRGGGVVDPTATDNVSDDVADPRELSVIGNNFENALGIGIINKNLAYTSLNIDSNNTYDGGITQKSGL